MADWAARYQQEFHMQRRYAFSQVGRHFCCSSLQSPRQRSWSSSHFWHPVASYAISFPSMLAADFGRSAAKAPLIVAAKKQIKASFRIRT
jgi:hypothetical protein